MVALCLCLWDIDMVNLSRSQAGDVKSERLALWMVQQYLQKHVLIFDPQVLKELFKEADFKQEGSLDARSLAAAISGRILHPDIYIKAMLMFGYHIV